MANKKPRFNKLAESQFDTSGGQTFNDVPETTKPAFRTRPGDSDEGKWIKRTNEQLKGVYGFVDQEDNNYIAAWERVFENAGLREGVDFVRKNINGVEVPYLRNTAANREKVDEIRKTIHDENARTLGSIRQQAIRELKQEGRKATKDNIADKLEEYRAYASLSSNVDFVYLKEEQGDTSFSHYTDRLRNMHSGTPEFTKIVRDLANDVKREKQAERQKSRQTIRRRVKEDGVR